MKSFATIALMMGVATSTILPTNEPVQTPTVGFDILHPIESLEEDENAEPRDPTFYIEGIKGYYEGYYAAFYKASLESNEQECLNEETINNGIKLGNVLMHPWSAFANITDFQADMSFFSAAAQVMEDVSKCHFE